MNDKHNMSAAFPHGNVTFRRVTDEVAWMEVVNRTGVISASIEQLGRERAIQSVALQDVQAHARAFQAALLELITALGISEADGSFDVVDTGVCKALWNIENGMLVVDADDYAIEASVRVTRQAKNEDIAYILLQSFREARLAGLRRGIRCCSVR